MPKPRVLLIAESANPEWTSGPLIGWSMSRALAEIADTHLVAQIRNRGALIRAGLIEGKDFTAIDSELLAKWAYRIGVYISGGEGKGFTTSQALFNFVYYYFEYLVWKKFGKRILDKEWDVVHRITPISPTTPSLLAKKCKRANVPFVIGPINGGLPWPHGFNDARHKEKEWLSYVRDFYKILPGYISTRSCASAIIAGSLDTLRQIPAAYRDKCVYIPENGIDSKRFSGKSKAAASRPIKAVFVGRLVPYKGADMLIEAIAPLARNGDIILRVVGSGPQMEALKQIIERERIGDSVKLTGWIENIEMQKILSDADILTFPSIREFGGAVVLESMALGVVPIVVNYGGPGEFVTSSTGFFLRMGDRKNMIRQLRELLLELVKDPSRIDEKRSSAITRAQAYFPWEEKARQVLEVYNWVTGKRADKPDFGAPFPDINNSIMK